MKKWLSFFIPFMLLFLLSCKSGPDKPAAKVKTIVDSIKADIDSIHYLGMAKMGRLTKLQQQTKRLADSLSALPAKARAKYPGYKDRVDSLLKELEYAEFAMNKWMEEYYGNADSTVAVTKEKIDYLLNEKVKADKIKNYVLEGIRKADSVLHKNL